MLYLNLHRQVLIQKDLRKHNGKKLYLIIKMELIDLRKIKTIFICPDHNEMYKARCKYMFSLLQDMGFEQIIHYKSGSSEAYPLNLATYNILQMNMNEPVLILEDDIEFISNPNFII